MDLDLICRFKHHRRENEISVTLIEGIMPSIN